MKPKCPYCGKFMDKDIVLPPMSARTLRVYRAVAAAGDNGIMAKDLLVRMYDDEEWPTPGGPTVLRVQICELNKILADYNQRIVGRRTAGYRLTTFKKDHNDRQGK